MLKFVKWFFGLFSRYVSPFERKVDKFFKRIKSSDNIANIREKLLELMQENLIVVNVWLEKKFKGYVYLSKNVRRKMYEDVLAIVKKFEEECSSNSVDIVAIKKDLDSKGLIFPNGGEESIKYLAQIAHFLVPGKYYNYIKTASFGKLLRNPDEQKLEGDCNQIVTLYIYLYSLKFSLDDLKIKLLPEHVCLHFRGVDIEATNGSFQKYTENKEVLPVTEIISTNLLDLADFREDLQDISPRDVVKSAQLAYAVSSLKPLVAKNLNVAYHNLAVGALKVNDFETAIFYFGKAGDNDQLKAVYNNAAIYYMNGNNFSKASYYAGKNGDNDLQRTVKHNEGVYYMKAGSVDKALDIFVAIGDDGMKRACYAAKYNELVKVVAGDKTISDVRGHKSTYLKMLDLAGKMEDQKLADGIRKTLSQI